jgi:hypothetical protein
MTGVAAAGYTGLFLFQQLDSGGKRGTLMVSCHKSDPIFVDDIDRQNVFIRKLISTKEGQS